ncbi:hypothetical protein GOP47_0014359 [Adiantum capillus-veneris]|uniref:UBX domain-containing protein n=1 Tax=Adiantum capillus-veneris TaxID=13818 RepID=A0A9D4ZES5_ADICA|nr:hypothetical protein GOP47_0014359 [Adiantum capillus-veneris]
MLISGNLLTHAHKTLGHRPCHVQTSLQQGFGLNCTMDPEQVHMFVSITGASEEVAFDKLQAHGGNLNAAINSFYNDGELPHPVQRENTEGPQWMEEDEPPIRPPVTSFPPYPPLNNPAWSGRLPASREPGLADDQASQIPFRDTIPIVSRTRSLREVHVDWRDDAEPRVRSRDAILESENAHLSSQSPTDFVSDEDEVSGPASMVSRAPGDRLPFETIRSGADYNFGNANPSAPLPAIGHNEGADIEEEMVRAAIEASRKETTEMLGLAYGEGQSSADLAGRGRHTEDDDMAWALSQSLKTAEEEKELRRRLLQPGSPQQGLLQEDVDNHLNPSTTAEYGLLHRKGSPSARDNIIPEESGPPSNNSLPSGLPILNTPVGHIDSTDTIDESEEFEEQPLRRRSSNRRRNSSFTPPIPEDRASLLGAQEDQHADAYPSSSIQANGHVGANDEWGGLSSEEQHDAVMLEAAMFGSLPEDVAARFRYPLTGGRVVEDADLSDDGGLPNYPRPPQQPPSPSVIAQRLLREQQDDEYLASLVADQEKEARVKLEEEMRRLKEVEAKAAAQEEHRLQQEEAMRKSVAAEELERQLAAKRAALPEEPSIDDEAAVTLMVRMPDGSRQGRRFRKSDHLQCLFDFIDVSGAVQQGSYRLVRQYPRKALTDGEHDSSFQDLGLSSKHEVLFLELV